MRCHASRALRTRVRSADGSPGPHCYLGVLFELNPCSRAVFARSTLADGLRCDGVGQVGDSRSGEFGHTGFCWRRPSAVSGRNRVPAMPSTWSNLHEAGPKCRISDIHGYIPKICGPYRRRWVEHRTTGSPVRTGIWRWPRIAESKNSASPPQRECSAVARQANSARLMTTRGPVSRCEGRDGRSVAGEPGQGERADPSDEVDELGGEE